MITTDFLHKLDRFSLIINKRITSNYVGERFSAETGRGLIFKDHTIYVPGEDFRSVDWRVFGRTDKLFVKRYEEERNLSVHIVLDFSASMGFGTKITKADYASMIGIGFAYLALKNNEKFVLSTFSDKVEVFKARKGRAQMASMVEYLNTKKPRGVTKLHDSLASYKKLINTRSYVVIVSDFLYPIEEIRRTLAYFKHHTVVLIQVLDKLERHLTLQGDYKLNDLESHEVLRTYINPYARKVYEKQLDDHIAKIQRTADEFNSIFYSCDTGMNIFDVFYDVVGRKR